MPDYLNKNGETYTEQELIGYAEEDLKFIDVNGDGKADVVYRRDGTSQWYARLSLGHRFGERVALGTTLAIPDYNNAYGLADVNGDGKIDLIGYHDDGEFLPTRYENYAG